MKLTVESSTMQPARYLMQNLAKFANADRYLFTPQDLRCLFPSMSDAAFKTLLSRSARKDRLVRICRGLYLYEPAAQSDGLLLFHAAARLRADGFNYISLETVLSDAGVISQVPINSIFIMSSGRTSVIDCGKWGAIHFVHTNQKPENIMAELAYDQRCKLWRASVTQALRDMRATQRNSDLIDWSMVNF